MVKKKADRHRLRGSGPTDGIWPLALDSLSLNEIRPQTWVEGAAEGGTGLAFAGRASPALSVRWK